MLTTVRPSARNACAARTREALVWALRRSRRDSLGATSMMLSMLSILISPEWRRGTPWLAMRWPPHIGSSDALALEDRAGSGRRLVPQGEGDVDDQVFLAADEAAAAALQE